VLDRETIIYCGKSWIWS